MTTCNREKNQGVEDVDQHLPSRSEVTRLRRRGGILIKKDQGRDHLGDGDDSEIVAMMAKIGVRWGVEEEY